MLEGKGTKFAQNIFMKLFPLSLVIIFFLSSSLGFAGPKQQGNQVTIPVNLAYSLDSLWSEDEIRRRFAYNSEILANACESFQIRLELNEIVSLKFPALQEISGYLNEESLKQLNQISGSFLSDLRPLIIYTKTAYFEGMDRGSEYLAQAYTFDGPRSLDKHRYLPWNGFEFEEGTPLAFARGDLEWDRLDELSLVHGVALIAQGNSERHDYNHDKDRNDVFAVDAHELGHILLNDGSHRYSPNNIMADKDRLRFDPDQCELIKSYHQHEANRINSVKKGMREICEFAKLQNLAEIPEFCRGDYIQ